MPTLAAIAQSREKPSVEAPAEVMRVSEGSAEATGATKGARVRGVRAGTKLRFRF
jgi:hypothetical protein